MRVRVCERCGAVIDNTRPKSMIRQRVWYSEVRWSTSNAYRDEDYDFCDKCTESLREWMDNGEKVGNDFR